MKKIALLLIIALMLISSASCGKANGRRSFFALDTYIEIDAPDASEELLRRCEQLVYRLEDILSATIETSDIARFNASEGYLELSDETAEVIRISLDIAAETSGAFDPTLGALVELWNIPYADSTPSDADIALALTHTGYEKLTLDGSVLTCSDPKLSIALGGAAKGYICQRAVELLKSECSYGIVSFGGNIGVFGEKPDGSAWRVAVKNPENPDEIADVIEISSGFVSVSGDYERYIEVGGVRYCHIFDRSTGFPPVNGVHSAAVWSNNGTAADALSTAVFVLGGNTASSYEHKAWLIAGD
ncbi:MAG: FAD:protein FMN transferase [Eubacteriales bacterium]